MFGKEKEWGEGKAISKNVFQTATSGGMSTITLFWKKNGSKL